jgi:tRNA-Thr(GGU) m(6)t(6)A37 methyltransferase TsaA
MEFNFTPIGVIRSCFPEKFGVPRQAGLVREAAGSVALFPPFDSEEALRGLEAFSHIWITFVFHENLGKNWSPTVRPPRLGGNRRIGVFASRSGFRPNPVGISAVRLEGIVREAGDCRLQVRGLDLVDGTPVLDIKPYVPYADAIAGARAGYAVSAPEPTLSVIFSAEAEATLARLETERQIPLRRLVENLLALDPRPAYRRQAPGAYGTRLYDLDIRWQAEGSTARVVSVETADPEQPDSP